MSNMGNIGALVVASTLATSGQEIPAGPVLKTTYNALESAGSKDGMRERMYSGFKTGGKMPVTWNGFHEMNMNKPQSYLGYDVLSFGNGGTRPALMMTSTSEDTSVRAGIKSEDVVKRLGGNVGYLDVSSGAKDANATLFYGKKAGPVFLELFESMNEYHGTPGKRNGELSFYSEIQIDKDLGALGKKMCGPVCDGVEAFYRLEFGGAMDWHTHLYGVRTTFKAKEFKRVNPAMLARRLIR